MSDDEKAIRQAIKDWMAASRAGDTAAVLSLMTSDAVFMTPGQEPFGRERFASLSGGPSPKVEGLADILELNVLGDWAFVRSRLALTVTPPNGAPIARSGYTLTLFRKGADGRWRLARDANLVA